MSHTPGVLDKWFERLEQGGDFPAMSEQLVRVQAIASGENESLNRLTNEILKDVGLTQKLLRIVNSAEFAHARAGGVTTVSRAVSLIGFVGIRNLAMSLVVLNHMPDQDHADRLKLEFLRALFSGLLAEELAVADSDKEEVFLGAMFQNLGRLLVGFYNPQDADTVVRRMADKGVGEVDAARAVLGLTFEELGIAVARHWGLPDGMQRLMWRPESHPPLRAPADTLERLRWTAFAANQVADAVWQDHGSGDTERWMSVARRFGGVLGRDATQLARALEQAREKLVGLVNAIELRLPSEHGLVWLTGAPVTPSEIDVDGTPTVVAVPVGLDLLVQGVQDTTAALAEGVELADVLRMVLETMYRALGMQRILLCLRDGSGQVLSGRFGLGVGATALVKRFRVELQASDLFGAVSSKGVDTLITDLDAPQVVGRLPAWFAQMPTRPHAFLLLPMQMNGQAVGLVYADWDGVVPEVGAREMALLKSLRNQALMALRQSRP